MNTVSRQEGPGGRLAVTRRLLAYVPAAAWGGLLLLVGSAEYVPGPSTSLPVDKLAHFVGYGLLGALAVGGWRRAGGWPPRTWLLILVLGLAALDELNQMRVPGRSAEFADWLADAAGALTAFILLGRSRRSKSREGAA